MELYREEIVNGPVIAGFAGRRFRVGQRIYDGGLLIDPTGVTEWNAPAELADLVPDMLGGLLDVDPTPEFLLLGTGVRVCQPARAFVRALESRGIGVEAMDSRAAARAWGVLRQEDRQVVGAFLPL